MLCNTLVLGIGDKHRVPDVFVFFFFNIVPPCSCRAVISSSTLTSFLLPSSAEPKTESALVREADWSKRFEEVRGVVSGCSCGVGVVVGVVVLPGMVFVGRFLSLQ